MKILVYILLGFGFGMCTGYIINDLITEPCPPQTVNHIQIRGVKSKNGGTLNLKTFIEDDTQEVEKKSRKQRRQEKRDKE